ncbi:MAG: HupE/UreJ family protein [Gammaproteobacteria bacterium]|nr:HupE/UreJ family protein [Gammaproteobacteria bacterium]
MTKQKYIQLLLLQFVLSLVFSVQVSAHEIRPAIVDFKIADNSSYEIQIRLNLEAIIARIDPKHSNTDESKSAQEYNILRKLSPDALTQSFELFKPQFFDGLYITAENKRLTPKITDVEIPAVGDIKLARDSIIKLSGKVPANAKNIQWRWQDSFGANALRVSSHDNSDLYSVYLQAGDQSKAISLDGLIKQSHWQVFSNYVVIGFEHIIPKGLDHILFVVGLFLLSIKLSPLLWQITSFTIAHSVTLALAVLGYIQLPASIVEPLIALSIVYVSVENMISDKLHRWRPIIIFLFGLLHGLGFASVLHEIGLNNDYLLTGLIAFNAGLEVGQISVILGCFLLVGIWFRHKPWYRSRITTPASLIIALIGTFWVIERVFF